MAAGQWLRGGLRSGLRAGLPDLIEDGIGFLLIFCLHVRWDADNQFHGNQFSEVVFEPAIVVNDPGIGIKQFQ